MASLSVRVGRVVLDEEKLRKAATEGQGVADALESEARAIAGRANRLSSGFRTQETTVYATGEHVGGTQPDYGSMAPTSIKNPHALVYTGNYAAMKDNYENNTLLKARG